MNHRTLGSVPICASLLAFGTFSNVRKGEVDAFHHRYRYDADNRIVLAETSSEEIIWDRDAKYFYYDHGPLARTEIGHHKVQGIDHAYTVQGWLKAVNSNLLFEARDMGQDAEETTTNLNKYVGKDEFGYSLGYFDNDYQAKSNNAADLVASLNIEDISKDLFNGNIKYMATAIDHFDQTAQVMQYEYDQLNLSASPKLVQFKNRVNLSCRL